MGPKLWGQWTAAGTFQMVWPRGKPGEVLFNAPRSPHPRLKNNKTFLNYLKEFPAHLHFTGPKWPNLCTSFVYPWAKRKWSDFNWAPEILEAQVNNLNFFICGPQEVQPKCVRWENSSRGRRKKCSGNEPLNYKFLACSAFSLPAGKLRAKFLAALHVWCPCLLSFLNVKMSCFSLSV